MYTDYSTITKRAVYEFGERNKTPPKRIVFFRDGLSEGEYAGVGKEEIEDIQGESVKRQQFLYLTTSTRGD